MPQSDSCRLMDGTGFKLVPLDLQSGVKIGRLSSASRIWLAPNRSEFTFTYLTVVRIAKIPCRHTGVVQSAATSLMRYSRRAAFRQASERSGCLGRKLLMIKWRVIRTCVLTEGEEGLERGKERRALADDGLLSFNVVYCWRASSATSLFWESTRGHVVAAPVTALDSEPEGPLTYEIPTPTY